VEAPEEGMTVHKSCQFWAAKWLQLIECRPGTGTCNCVCALEGQMCRPCESLAARGLAYLVEVSFRVEI